MAITAEKELACLVAEIWREGAILGVSAGISQISRVPGLDGFANLFLFLVE